ncbi:MAG: hypothetical protein BWZ03_00073 [bacterium ADurb.BinA186]|nr:MAG: hypothetical protein BWZ03_00073 [bacterium ADurb.BinA186]
MNESELRAANNDGMDPYWKFQAEPTKIKLYTQKIESLYWIAKRLHDGLERFSDEFLEENKFKDFQHGWIRSSISVADVIKLRKALKELES